MMARGRQGYRRRWEEDYSGVDLVAASDSLQLTGSHRGRTACDPLDLAGGRMTCRPPGQGRRRTRWAGGGRGSSVAAVMSSI